ncbi:ATP-binding protein [Cryptosporangium arvum]|nr:LuxR family transcriptional regulator [Cryptosporangium arvum]
MDAPARGHRIFGRDAELNVLRVMLSEAAEGRGAALLIRGAAGVGKSELLRSVGATAAAEQNLTVLSAAGAEPERWFPFATLQLLLQPMADRINTVPGTHRMVLRGLFGGAEAMPDVYRVGLAVLELLAEAAERQPVLLLIDDMHWVDSSSRDVLGFVARRVSAHAVVVLAASRSTEPAFPEMHLEPLAPTAAADLLDASGRDLAAPLRTLILERAAGNPLALVELPKAAPDAPLGPDDLPLTRRLETAFADRTTTMSPTGRTFLRVLAAAPTAPTDRLLEATGQLTGEPVGIDAIQEALDADLVSVDRNTIEFRHPLMRSAIYEQASAAERHAIHRTLAAVLSDDIESRLVHEAAATIGCDDELADRLVDFAEQSRSLGRLAASVQALRRAAELMRDAQRRTTALVLAAELSSQLSDRHRTQALLARANLSVVGPVERARLLIMSDSAAFEPDEPHRRISDMTIAAGGAFDAGAREVAEDLLWRAAARCFFQDADRSTRAKITAELARWRPDPASPHAVIIRAYAEPYLHGSEVIRGLNTVSPGSADGRLTHFLGSGAMVIGEFTGSTRYLARAAAALRSQGRLGLLARTLAGAWPRFYLGQLDRARADAEEGLQLARETGETIASLGLGASAGLIAAMRGDHETATQRAQEVRASSMFDGMPFAAAIVRQTDGLLALQDGRATEAYAILASVFDPTDPHHHSVSRWLLVPDLADAAVLAGTVEHARELLGELPRLTGLLPSEMMRTAHAYATAVLASDESAEQAYSDGIAALPSGVALIRARLQLHHGRWLRRQRRYTAAREPLRAARDAFDRLGARPWAETASSQLRASGEVGNRRRPSPGEQLSPQELQIAVLASQGLTNRQIGERLFISHRTVGAHLYRIFPRLGLTDRRQLAAALAAGGLELTDA